MRCLATLVATALVLYSSGVSCVCAGDDCADEEESAMLQVQVSRDLLDSDSSSDHGDTDALSSAKAFAAAIGSEQKSKAWQGWPTFAVSTFLANTTANTSADADDEAVVPAPYPAPAPPQNSSLLPDAAATIRLSNAEQVLTDTLINSTAEAANDLAASEAEAEAAYTPTPAPPPYTALNVTEDVPTMQPLANVSNQTQIDTDREQAAKDCEVSEWGDWGICVGSGSGMKQQVAVRTRTVVTPPQYAEGGSLCPMLSEEIGCAPHDRRRVTIARPAPA